MMDTKPRKVALSYVAALDEDEMVARYIEASEGLIRPPGMSAVAALTQLQGTNGDEIFRIRKGLRAVMAYWREQISSMQKTN